MGKRFDTLKMSIANKVFDAVHNSPTLTDKGVEVIGDMAADAQQKGFAHTARGYARNLLTAAVVGYATGEGVGNAVKQTLYAQGPGMALGVVAQAAAKKQMDTDNTSLEIGMKVMSAQNPKATAALAVGGAALAAAVTAGTAYVMRKFGAPVRPKFMAKVGAATLLVNAAAGYLDGRKLNAEFQERLKYK